MRHFLAVLFLGTTMAFGQAGSIDTTFNPESFLHPNCGYGTSYAVNDVLHHSNGTIYFCGIIGEYNCTDGAAVMHIDQTGHTIYAPSNTIVANPMKLAAQADGKILIGGAYLSGYPALGRMDENGTIDLTFNPGTGVGVSGTVQDIVVQPDGKILIAGGFSDYNGVPRKNITRLNSDGSLDPTFDPGVGPNAASSITSIVLQPDGKIVVAGSFTTFNGIAHNRIVRLNSDGQIDPDFQAGAGFNNLVRKIVLQNDGKIVACGAFTQFNGSNSRYVSRINADGSPDPSFSVGDPFMWSYAASSVSLTADQKIIVTGTFYEFAGEDHPRIVKLNTNGSIDNSFHSTLYISGDYSGADIAPDGHIMVFGDFLQNYRTSNNIARLTPTGDVDLTFNPRYGADNNVLTSCTQPDGKILIGGELTSFNQVRAYKMARVNSDGTVDNSFVPSLNTNGNVLTIAVQSDGKILAGGEFTYYWEASSSYMVRRNADGTVDPTFNMATGFDDRVNKIVVQPDQKILVGGLFTTLNGVSCPVLIRLHSDGTRDNSFNPAFSNSADINDILLQEDGKMIIAGSFVSVNGQDAFRLVRLNADGTTDNTFASPPTMLNDIRRIARQSDGKVLAANGYEIVRFNADGTPDTIFGTKYFNNTVSDVCVQSDDKIIVGGSFTSDGVNANNYVTRLMADGSDDSSMYVGNFDWSVYHLALQPDGKLLVGGGFNDYQDTVVNRVFRMITDAAPANTLAVTVDSLSAVGCDEDGFLSLQVTGGMFPYSYEWQTTPVQTTPQITFDTAGIYTCLVTDAMGLSRSISVLTHAPFSQTGHELKPFMIAASGFRPGFSASVTLDGLNDGCIPATGQLKLVVDPLLDFVSANPVPDAISGDTLIWSFTDLTHDSAHITPQIAFNTPETAVIGDTVHFTLIMTPLAGAGDADTTNNSKTYAFPVVNGYDPNDKAVYPVGKCEAHYVVPEQTLTYTVRFQNTGNSEAINIAVVDSLDADLDLNTVRVIGKSHEMWTEVLPGNVLKFHFDGIHLADSTSNEAESHGYVIFEVVPATDSEHNTDIDNRVEIYFDFNPAVVTNTVHNRIFDGENTGFGNLEDYNCFVGMDELGQASLLVFPNPTKGSITVQSEKLNGAALTLVDLQGKIVLQKSAGAGSETELDMEALQSGSYLLHVRATDATMATIRIVKQ